MAPHIEGAKRQYLIEARPIVKILHAKTCGGHRLAVAGWHLHLLAKHFRAKFFSCQWSRFVLRFNWTIDRTEIIQQSARGKNEWQTDGNAHPHISLE
jgi:hypothetical protein